MLQALLCMVLTSPAGRRTPVYMAPEINDKARKDKGYNAQMVDVWASGVLLIVMLLGQFPFDHLQNPDPNSPQAHLEVW